MEKLLTIKDLANMLSYSENTIKRYVREGKMPKPSKIFSKNVWKQSDIEHWLKEKGINLNNKEGVDG